MNFSFSQIRSCLSAPRNAKKKGGFRFGRKQKEVPVPPVMPPAGKCIEDICFFFR